jgi:type I restriction enzyme M protein
MKLWTDLIQKKLREQKNRIAELDVEKATVKYSQKIKQHRVLKNLTGDEEVVRAFLIDRLVNELDYLPEIIEIEKE